MHSLRFKILAVATTLVLLSQAATVSLVLFTANRDVAERASESLVTGSNVAGNALQSRGVQFENTVRALASDYGFKQAVGTGDRPTVESALANHANRADADIAFIVDADGRLIAVEGIAPRLLTTSSAFRNSDQSGESNHQTVILGGAAYEIYTLPVRAPLPIAFLSMGFLLDDELALQLHDLTGLDVTLITNTAQAGGVLASSLPITTRQSVADFGKAEIQFNVPFFVDANGEVHLAIVTPFGDGHSSVRILLTKSLAAAMAPYNLLKTASIPLGLLPLLAALAGAALLSRALTQPVMRLMEAARRIQSGDYGTPVEIRSGDELSHFGTTFNAMQDEIAAREERISYQARHDSVTGLYNGDYALELLAAEISAARSGSHTLALLIVRLNSLADISSSLGHDIANAYLREAASKLRRFVDSSFTLARLENDAFLVSMMETENCLAQDVADDIIEVMGSGIRLPSVNVDIGPSIGIAIFPEHAENPDSLLLRATIALNEAAREGRRTRLYRKGDEELRVRNMRLLQDLKSAADNDELQLHCQPKISLVDEQVCGVEALVRWEHPEYGWLPPNEFIPLVERSGNISVITRWVLRRSVEQLGRWHKAGRMLTMAVNLSARDLQDNDLPWFIMDLVKAAGIEPRFLVLEITEEAMVLDFGHASSNLRRLHDLGVRIAIDDFGTGYSSLAQLKNLPVDELKIDRAFVMRLPADGPDRAIVSSVIELAHKLDLLVVAEGVSSSAACQWLQAQGVEHAQGFYWSEPLAAAAIPEWLDGFDGGATRQVEALKLV